MLARVHHLLDLQANLIHSLDFDAVADFYDVPLSAYAGGELIVYRSRLAFIHGLQTITGKYRAAGMRSLVWNIGAIELVRDGRFRVWVTWDHVFADRVQTAATEITYFCRLGPETLTVEMVQFKTLNSALMATQTDQTAQRG